MPLLPLIGHEALRARLSDAAARRTLPASLLLHGPRGAGKQRLALWLGSLLLCGGTGERPCGSCPACRYSAELAHPDLHWFFPRPRLKDADPSVDDVRDDVREAIADRVKAGGLYAPPSGTEGIYVATVRAIVSLASMSPAIGSRKVFVVGDAERMVPQEGADMAANAFLKLLEEPPADTTIILTTSEPGALLATIRSRVAALRVPRLRDEEVRVWLGRPEVSQALDSLGVPKAVDRRVEMAAGAPGILLGSADRAGALDAARRLLDAAAGDRTLRYRVAYAQGASKARGAFSDTLDALTLLLHERMRDSVARRDEGAALRASRAVDAVERAKSLAAGNVNPQLVGAALLRELSGALR